MLRATGGLSAPNNSYLQAGAPGAGQLPAPIRYNGGRGAYGRPAGSLTRAPAGEAAEPDRPGPARTLPGSPVARAAPAVVTAVAGTARPTAAAGIPAAGRPAGRRRHLARRRHG